MEHKIYLAGEFIQTRESLAVNNPFSGEIVSTTWLAGKEEIEKAIQKAEEAFQVQRKLPAYKKQEILLGIAAGLKQHKKKLAELLSLESAKPIKYAGAEIDRSIQSFIIASEECKRLPREYIGLDWTVAGENREGLVKHFPLGIVAGIAPFNFPLNLAVHKIAPAIAASCPIILKPASATPLSTLELAKIIHETALPHGSVSVLPCSRNTGNLLVEHEKIKLLSFTGSPEVGWLMKQRAGRKKTVLELGGNAAVIIDRDADLENTVNKCLYGAFAYSGQICIHAQRIYVQEELWEDFTHLFLKKMEQMKFGNPLDEQTDISVMIDEANAKRVEQWLKEAMDAGAKLLKGGIRKGNYIEPTVLTNTHAAMRINSEEVFGPVVCIEKFDKMEEAIKEVNNTRFGLQCGVFTNRLNEMEKCFQELEVGGIIINDVPTIRFDHMPYGGIKDSGQGREGIKYAIQEMMEPKILVR